YDVVNTYSHGQLTRIMRDYGEERFASRIAANILKDREIKPIETTLELVEIIKRSIPAAKRREGGHPAKRAFQAIRIEVNGELEHLEHCLDNAFERLNSGGRFAIITFHSLEDRMVKQKFLGYAKGCTCPPDFPICVCGNLPKAKVITRKPIEASEQELETNNRSRSAKLRLLEKI
ncbi:MAG: 16S rRNA (cytosine(1402)-N(4))-methyltransferase RsmH, partial [Oscillospiraceae bacterium]